MSQRRELVHELTRMAEDAVVRAGMQEAIVEAAIEKMTELMAHKMAEALAGAVAPSRAVAVSEHVGMA